MCGIAGYVANGKKNKNIIHAMCEMIKHRGPDGEGYYLDNYVALGHRRLSIIDLSTGNQPMFNEDESIVTIFNGEIYNYLELKEELQNYGHQFKTKSDTEVLVHGYEQWHEQLPSKLRGMFAFVIWDKNEKKLFGARDHFGIKPLYYTTMNNEFLFASEIKAFLVYPKFKKKFNDKLLGPYLEFNYVPTTETFFKEVYRLNPGEYFTYMNNKLTIDKYFDLTFKSVEENFDKIVDNISNVIENSVQKHMLSDVEVGSFLSSGIDSSYIVSLAKPNKTYTIGYRNEKYDEATYAKNLSKILKIKNKTKIINSKEYLDVVPSIMYYLDEPLADPSAISLYFLSQLAAKDVKVVLSGEGADEFFGGYNSYKEEIDYSFYNKIPFFIRSIISKIFSIFPEKRGINFLVRRGKKLEDFYIGVNQVFSEKEINNLLKNPIKFKSSDITAEVFKKYNDQENVVKRQAIDINFWLIKDIFQKADRMTMANSIEGRVPFSDIEVFNVARTLSQNAKLNKVTTKVALREAAKRVIPNEAYKKKKLGFPVPLRDWLKTDYYYLKIKESFKSEVALKFFDENKILKLLDDHKYNKKDNYKKIWTIYCFILWYQEFFEN